ncbi:hypothetical protein ADUPG1_012212 [Aduncisulcus paluster]|uniref:Uncharacterized protein n=1 Tax=Aduncisulcus paluster TaxID=2918883 RepID=A0ABQ5JYP7_9EUKA|nr:hypothetical protein ADUPG1_012212 [Aduncisulcus paluster]
MSPRELQTHVIKYELHLAVKVVEQDLSQIPNLISLIDKLMKDLKKGFAEHLDISALAVVLERPIMVVFNGPVFEDLSNNCIVNVGFLMSPGGSAPSHPLWVYHGRLHYSPIINAVIDPPRPHQEVSLDLLNNYGKRLLESFSGRVVKEPMELKSVTLHSEVESESEKSITFAGQRQTGCPPITSPNLNSELESEPEELISSVDQRSYKKITMADIDDAEHSPDSLWDRIRADSLQNEIEDIKIIVSLKNYELRSLYYGFYSMIYNILQEDSFSADFYSQFTSYKNVNLQNLNTDEKIEHGKIVLAPTKRKNLCLYDSILYLMEDLRKNMSPRELQTHVIRYELHLAVKVVEQDHSQIPNLFSLIDILIFYLKNEFADHLDIFGLAVVLERPIMVVFNGPAFEDLTDSTAVDVAFTISPGESPQSPGESSQSHPPPLSVYHGGLHFSPIKDADLSHITIPIQAGTDLLLREYGQLLLQRKAIEFHKSTTLSGGQVKSKDKIPKIEGKFIKFHGLDDILGKIIKEKLQADPSFKPRRSASFINQGWYNHCGEYDLKPPIPMSNSNVINGTIDFSQCSSRGYSKAVRDISKVLHSLLEGKDKSIKFSELSMGFNDPQNIQGVYLCFSVIEDSKFPSILSIEAIQEVSESESESLITNHFDLKDMMRTLQWHYFNLDLTSIKSIKFICYNASESRIKVDLRGIRIIKRLEGEEITPKFMEFTVVKRIPKKLGVIELTPKDSPLIKNDIILKGISRNSKTIPDRPLMRSLEIQNPHSLHYSFFANDIDGIIVSLRRRNFSLQKCPQNLILTFVHIDSSVTLRKIPLGWDQIEKTDGPAAAGIKQDEPTGSKWYTLTNIDLKNVSYCIIRGDNDEKLSDFFTLIKFYGNLSMEVETGYIVLGLKNYYNFYTIKSGNYAAIIDSGDKSDQEKTVMEQENKIKDIITSYLYDVEYLEYIDT